MTLAVHAVSSPGTAPRLDIRIECLGARPLVILTSSTSTPGPDELLRRGVRRTVSTFHARLGRLIRYRRLGMGVVLSGDYARLRLLHTSGLAFCRDRGPRRLTMTIASAGATSSMPNGARGPSRWDSSEPEAPPGASIVTDPDDYDETTSAAPPSGSWARNGPSCLACRGLEMASGPLRLPLACMNRGTAPWCELGLCEPVAPCLSQTGREPSVRMRA